MVRLLVALCLLVPTVALAVPGPLATPALKEGQYVYTVPDGFDAKGIGASGVEEIQAAAKALHFPFYVIIADRIPALTGDQIQDARAHGYTESGDDLVAAYAVDKLAEDFANTPFYKADTSTVFLLSYTPRKYRMLAGSKWKTDLHLERDALVPFHDHFKHAVSGTPKNPKGGIINTMRAFDDYVFDQVDPERIAARKKAEAEAAAEAERRAHDVAVGKAKSALSALVAQSKTLLGGDAEFLPPDTKILSAAIKEIENGPYWNSEYDDLPAITKATGTLQAAYDPVKAFYDKKESDHTMMVLGNVFWTFVFLVALGFAAFLYIQRRKEFTALRDQFNREYEAWSERVRNAGSKYVDAYADRDNIIGLGNTTGKTKALWDSLSAEIDDIWLGVKALEDHFERCKEWASKATMFRMNPLRVALSELEAPFDFDTGVVNKDELFGGETKTIRIDPKAFAKSLKDRFKKNQASWDTLKEAAEIRFVAAIEKFPHTTLNDIYKEAADLGIPVQWYSDHPLAGDDEADAKVWADADKVRSSDPIAYHDVLADLHAKEKTVVDRHKRLVAACKTVKDAEPTIVDLPDTKYGNPADDPRITLSHFRDLSVDFTGALASNALGKDPANIESRAKALVEKANEYREKAAKVCRVVAEIEKDLAQLKGTDLSALKAKVNDKYRKACGVHRKAMLVEDTIKTAEDLEAAGWANVKRAEQLVAEGRHMDAWRKTSDADEYFANARKVYGKAEEAIFTLDKARDRYIAEVGQYNTFSGLMEKTVKKYKGSFKPVNYVPVVDLAGPLDYAAEMDNLNAAKARLERQARDARAAEEARLAAIRAEEDRRERARRRAEEEAEEAEERRRRSYSSYSSYSSSSSSSYSSGSSWDSGGSSSSGSSWGGDGGSSSSGGDW